MVTNDLSNSIHGIGNRRSRRMVLDRRSNGNLCRRSNPYSNNGGSAGSRQVGDSSMVAPELEEDITVDEILSDICSISVDGDYISGYLRVSLQGTS